MIISKIKKTVKSITTPSATQTITPNSETLISRVTEEDIREEAYKIWESEGRQGDSLTHWFRAKENIQKKILNSTGK